MKNLYFLSVLAVMLPACASLDKPVESVQLYQTVTLDIEGPNVTEQDQVNPFTDYRVMVEFTHAEKQVLVRGYFAGDGQAAESSASEGDLWQVNFSPDLPGQWNYQVHFDTGKDIALSSDLTQGEETDFDGETGQLQVDSRAVGLGRLTVQDGYFYPLGQTQPKLKVGANSPENLFGYTDFDGTYRVQPNKEDEGKAQDTHLHTFEPHARDWHKGDISWQGKGKNLIGALNYLTAEQMNAVYFITMNIKGDGKDTWPYLDHKTLDRFDVSKLAQWQKVFEHMQNKGLIMHVVLQETENETLLDDGDTGYYRKLYLNEMIARFAHFRGVIWNIGEENGPVKWSPVGQTPEQVITMARYIKAQDPYKNPVLVHSHASQKHKQETLTGLLGEASIDGISLQVDQPARVTQDIQYWQKASKEAGHLWAISMDEIGIWHTGARPDKDNPSHQDMRTQVLWPAMFNRVSGIEWYFGYRYAHNDLDAEDWRSRSLLWQQTAKAKAFFEDAQLYSLTSTCSEAKDKSFYCLTDQSGRRALLYLPNWEKATFKSNLSGRFKVRFFNPLSGQWHAREQLLTITPGQMVRLTDYPDNKQADWAIELIRH
ncbi:DUF5060 domain-containing protein [Gayadomonas joobiniege]|uniref:DUF5060 domain-containing protein n=1 Tax=Gayadomonas joobiniege TaxID=1234606 RepID=UPI000374465C|nr:DUF5060 domain-containing protein [Gayadomonas joobiniege]